MAEQQINYYILPSYLVIKLSEYKLDVIHSFIGGEYVYAMIDISHPFHPATLQFTGYAISKDDYWQAYCRGNQLLYITGTPKIVNGKAVLSLKYHSNELIKILQTTGRIGLKNGESISLTCDKNIRFSKTSTGFEQILSNEVEVCYFEHIIEFVKDSTQEILDTYDETLRYNHKILNTKYELKI